LANSKSTIGSTIFADQDVEAAEGRDRLRRAGLDLIFVADVHRDAERSLPRRIDLARGRLGCVQVEIGDRDFCAFAREEERDLLADAARGAGDDCDLILQAHGPCPSGFEGVFSRQVIVPPS
jgi:hypothetical protein